LYGAVTGCATDIFPVKKTSRTANNYAGSNKEVFTKKILHGKRVGAATNLLSFADTAY
jgi:hypothetical protein